MQFRDTYFEAYSDGSQSFKIIVIPICDARLSIWQ